MQPRTVLTQIALRAMLVACAMSSAACSRAARTMPGDDASADEDARFSFFVTSYLAIQALSGSELGFGGDLRYGETGPGAGLRGADKICAEIAERSMPGASKKQWRAFLSATAGEDGNQVNAIDRIGEGPWYDRIGRLFAANKADLFNDRPKGADSVIAHDFPNEDGVPNQRPDADRAAVDNHDILTGTNALGQLHSAMATCRDWTSALGDPASEGRPHVGHSWDRPVGENAMPTGRVGDGGAGPMGMAFNLDGGRSSMMGGEPTIIDIDGAVVVAGDGGVTEFHAGEGDKMGGGSQNWMSALDEAGCAPGINLVQTGPPDLRDPTVGSGGGYGGLYCFATVQ